jgi:type II secretory ATPase GspE/PulE/Tfp pilus assembly ATPase PilB-like protein
MHAGEPATALTRLLEMGLAAYQVTSSIYGVLTLRLVRKKVGNIYNGRIPLGEFGRLDEKAAAGLLAHADAAALRSIFQTQPGHATLRMVAKGLVAHGNTDDSEIRRVLGDG